jgi:hypothetical protein
MDTFEEEQISVSNTRLSSNTFGHFVRKEEPVFVISNPLEIPKLTFFALFQQIIQLVLASLQSSKESKQNNEVSAEVIQCVL